MDPTQMTPQQQAMLAALMQQQAIGQQVPGQGAGAMPGMGSGVASSPNAIYPAQGSPTGMPQVPNNFQNMPSMINAAPPGFFNGPPSSFAGQ